jgi:hypothetical protein
MEHCHARGSQAQARGGHLVFATLAADLEPERSLFQRRRAAFLKPCS